MKKTIKILALILTVLLTAAVFTSCGSTPTVDKIKEEGKLIMLTNAAFPPFEYVDGSVIAGVDVDIANEIAKDLGVTLEISNMEFAGIVGAIKTGKGSIGVAGMSITDERKKNVDFSIEYVSSSLYILVKNGETEIINPDTLKNMTIGVQTGTTAELFARDLVEGAQISGYNSFLEATTALNSGKVRAVVVDKLTSDEILTANPDLVRLEEPLTEEKYAICVKKGNKTLLDAVNATLQRLLDEGKIEEFISNHMVTQEAEG